ncbi:MAG: glycosyltransferase [Paracoccaceae bacterium]
MNILQLLSSLNDDISIRAVAAHSKVLKNNNWNSYVFAPLGRELSYFKRWGAEIAYQHHSPKDIVYSKATIKELCNLVSSKSINSIHVYDLAGYKAALQVQKTCSIKIIMSLLQSTPEQGVLGKLNRTIFGEFLPQVSTLVPSKTAYKELLTKYSRKGIELLHVPIPVDFTVYDEKKISQERTISLATQWGMLEKPRHIIFAKPYFHSKKWQNQIIKLSVDLEKLPEAIKPYIVIWKNAKNKGQLSDFEEKYFKNRTSVLCLMDELTDFEAALKLTTIYLELNPQKDYYSLDTLNALAMGNAVVCWESEANKELLPNEYHKYLPANGATKTLEQILTDLLKMKSKDRDFTGRTSRNYVLNNFNVKNMEEPLINAYSTLSYRKAS